MILRKRRSEGVKVARELSTTSNTTTFSFVEAPNQRADDLFNQNRDPLKIERKAFLEFSQILFPSIPSPNPLEQA